EPIKFKDGRALLQKRLSLFRKAGRTDLADELERPKTPEERVAFSHSDLLAAKAVLGGEFERIIRAAELVPSIPLEEYARILDVGGGLGQLSFWMAHLWPTAKITLIEKASLDIPRRWAEDLRVTNVEFVNVSLEDAQLESGSYDLAVLSSFFS